MRNFLVEIHYERCKGCLLCVGVCPKKIIITETMSTNNNEYHPIYIESSENCIGCTNCALMCPEGAISIKYD